MFKQLLLSIAILSCTSANAGLVVIGSPDLAGSMELKDVKKLYLGKKFSFNGGNLTAIELDAEDHKKAEFHKQVTNKSLAQLASYWSKQLFTGKGKAPESVANQEAVKAKVAQGSTMVGYIDESLVDGQVSVLLKL